MRNIAEPEEEATPVQLFFCGKCALAPDACACACSRCGCDLGAAPEAACLGCAEERAKEHRCPYCDEERDGGSLTCGRRSCDDQERYNRRFP